MRELGRETKIDSHKIWDIVERLRQRGLVVKRQIPGGRKYVFLNRRLPIYRTLLNLLKALDHHWPTRRYRVYVARWRMPFDKSLTTERLDYMFQGPVRSRILLFVAAVGETDLTTIYNLLGLSRDSAWLAVNHWQKQSVLRDRRFKTRRLISLDPTFVVAKELRALLRTIIATSEEYDALRAAARKTLRPILKAAGANVNIPRRRASRSTG